MPLVEKANTKQHSKSGNTPKTSSQVNGEYIDNKIKKRKAGGKKSEVYHNGALIAPKKLKNELGRNCNLPSLHSKGKA